LVVDSRVSPQWNAATRIAFRFCFTYFGLYVLCTQMLGGLIVLPGLEIPELGSLAPLRNITSWIAAHLFGVREALVITGSGSGDKTFDWVQAFGFLAAAIVATTAWSAIDRRRGDYIDLHKWFRLFLRFALGSTMLVYGASKVIPLQMSAPSLLRLLEPFGNFSPMGVLWASIGASRPYEVFVGSAEFAAGVLLFMPGLTTLGALLALVDAIEIFTLNMTYDVPVKLFSFHLIVMSLVLLVPEASRLVDVIVLNRATGPSTEPPPGAGRRGTRALVALQLVFGAYLVAMNLYSSAKGWTQYGGGAPRSPLFGIWTVDEMSIDGHVRSPLTTDYDRWRRVVFQNPASVSFGRMDDTFVTYVAAIDVAANKLTLRRGQGKSPVGTLTFERPRAERLTLEGEMDGHKVRMQLQLVDRAGFQLVSRGFHWIQEYPFNR
jgi:hypothetical protein